MPKIPLCNRCSLYAHNQHYLVCGAHPMGVDTDSCLDFRPDPNIKDRPIVHYDCPGRRFC